MQGIVGTRFIFGLTVLISSTQSLASDIEFETRPYKHDVFALNDTAHASYSYAYMPFTDWLQKGSGKYFPMDVAPALSGLVSGRIRTPPVHGIDETKYVDQAREFAELVNERNKNGRPKVDLMERSASENLQNANSNTYVVEIVVSGLIDKPLAQLDVSAKQISSLPEKIDLDHYHFTVPGAFVEDVLEESHGEFANIRPEKSYVLSVFDFREYNCAAMKDGMRDYFSRSPERERLHNESIYVINQIDYNLPGDIAGVQKYFGRKPDVVVVQRVVYADHVIRAAKSVFAFFAEGQRTRLVLLSNVATKSKYFVGAKGVFLRQYVLDGIVGGGAVQSVTNAYLATKDKIGELLAGATDDVHKKNVCNRGLALGLVRYSQSLFGQFVHYLDH